MDPGVIEASLQRVLTDHHTVVVSEGEDPTPAQTVYRLSADVLMNALWPESDEIRRLPEAERVQAMARVSAIAWGFAQTTSWKVGEDLSVPLHNHSALFPLALAPEERHHVNRDKEIRRILTREWVEEALVGQRQLHFGAEVKYLDVFDHEHVLTVGGWFNPDRREFQAQIKRST